MKTLFPEDFMTREDPKSRASKHLRVRDPYLDRRRGEDRREKYSLYYFSEGGVERRISKERRINFERRKGFTRVSTWASACLTPPVRQEA
jgi:hypothetical protein